MARVRIHDVERSFPEPIRDWTTPEIKAQISQLELDSSIVVHERGGTDTLQLFEVFFLPDTEVDIHAHDEEEVMYVVGGEMIVGQRVLKPGSSIYIAGSTLYGFRAGPNGLRVLNFRPRIDSTYISKAAFETRRRERDGLSLPDEHA